MTVRSGVVLFALLGALATVAGCQFQDQTPTFGQLVLNVTSDSVNVRKGNLGTIQISIARNLNYYSEKNFSSPIHWADYVSVPNHSVVFDSTEPGGSSILITLDRALDPLVDTSVIFDTAKDFYGTDGAGIDFDGNPTQYRFGTPSVAITYLNF